MSSAAPRSVGMPGGSMAGARALYQQAAAEDSSANRFHQVRQRNQELTRAKPHGSFFVPSLQHLCARSIAASFADRPSFGSIPDSLVEMVTDYLSTDLPLDATVPNVHLDSYWKRCCISNLKSGEIESLTANWKQMYLEKKIQTTMCSQHNEREMNRLASLCKDYVQKLSVRRSKVPVDFKLLLSSLTRLVELDVSYGILSSSLVFKSDEDVPSSGPRTVGFTQKACTDLAEALKTTRSLQVLRLPENCLDGTKLRGILPGLLKNGSVSHLDLSHNKVDDDGARALSSFLRINTLLKELNLCDNVIHSEGGKLIGKSLAENRTLQSLNLRLNRLGEDGGKSICDALRGNHVIRSLNLASNELGSECVKVLADVLRVTPSLHDIDCSGNPNMGQEGGKAVLEAIQGNPHIISADFRMCGFHESDLRAINDIVKQRQKAEEVAMKAAAAAAQSSGAGRYS